MGRGWVGGGPHTGKTVMLVKMGSSDRPHARYRPRGQGFLVFEHNGRRVDLALDAERIDIPPPADARLAAPPPRATLDRIDGGHALSPLPGASVLINHRPASRRTVLRGGDAIEVNGWVAQYATAREELSWPITVIVWPPEGPPVEVRSHRARLTLGSGESDLQIDDDTLDGHHCTIRRFSNGIMALDDERSYNGVFVDGKKVATTASLRDGAEVRIGRTRLKAWAEATVRPDGQAARPEDEFDGLPSQGFDPKARAEPLRPYALEVGPDFVQTRRRTFDDDVPTRHEGLGEHVDVRARRRAEGADGYRKDPVREEPSDLPEWAPVAANAGKKRTDGAQNQPPPRRRSDEVDEADGYEFGRRKAPNLTLVHDGSGNTKKPRRPG